MTLHRLIRWTRALAGLAALALMPVAASAADAGPVVRTASGPVRGFVHDGVQEFRGLPFAAAPVGDLRFEPPKPVKPWTQVREARDYGAPCPQAARFNLTEASEVEDCLFVNVAVPNTKAVDGKPRPVIVWLHLSGDRAPSIRSPTGRPGAMWWWCRSTTASGLWAS